MSLKNRAFEVILRILCGLFFVIAIFLSVTAVVYSVSDGTPNIFGSNIYLVKTNAFPTENGAYILNEGTALIASKVPPSEIQPPNIVIFTLENGKPALAQVLSSNLYDGVYSFSVLTENNAEITLSQSQVLAKGMSYWDFLGGLITFATSPVGMLMIAIVPSIIIIILEIVKFAGKIMPQPEIETVKKQYEVPTYAPGSERQTRERRGTAEAARAYRNASLDNSIGIYDTGISEQVQSRRPAQRTRSDYADIAARQQQASQQNPLFTTPTRRPQHSQQRVTMPLSSAKLNEAIEATKAEHEREDMNKVRAQVVNDIRKTRGAAIAAEKEFENREKEIGKAARSTANLAKTAVISNLTRQQTAELTQNARQAAAIREEQSRLQNRQQNQQRRIQRPALRLNQPEDRTQQLQDPSRTGQLRDTQTRTTPSLQQPVRQYTPTSRNTNTTTSIPRLDSLLREDSDNGAPYNIDDILAGLDRRSGNDN